MNMLFHILCCSPMLTIMYSASTISDLKKSLHKYLNMGSPIDIPNSDCSSLGSPAKSNEAGVKIMRLGLYTLCPLIYFSMPLYSAELLYTFRLAETKDVTSVLNIINTEAQEEKDKIVVLPKMFRESAIEKEISQKRLFIATDQENNVVAFKKLFIITDHSEFKNIGSNELRFLTPSALFVDANIYDTQGNKTESLSREKLPLFSLENSVVIYFGGDYTVRGHRDKGINSGLTKQAFNLILDTCTDMMRNNTSLTNLAIVYGLTKMNAGERGGIDRTPSIVRAFCSFAAQIFVSSTSSIIGSRFQSCMPTFDFEATECKPLADNHAVAGFGNVLIVNAGRK